MLISKFCETNFRNSSKFEDLIIAPEWEDFSNNLNLLQNFSMKFGWHNFCLLKK